jgi:hypothetical protein
MFNASGLSSGIYLYQIKSGDFVDTKKMILMKQSLTFKQNHGERIWLPIFSFL